MKNVMTVFVITIGLLFLGLSQPLSAKMRTFTSQSSFLNTSGNTLLEDFNSAEGFRGSTLTFHDFTVVEAGSSPGIGFFDSTAVPATSKRLALNLDRGSSIIFYFNKPTRAIGFSLINPLKLVLDLKSNTRETARIPTPRNNNPLFFGVISDRPFTQITIAARSGSRGQFLSFDDVRVGSESSPVPAPVITSGTSDDTGLITLLWEYDSGRQSGNGADGYEVWESTPTTGWAALSESLGNTVGSGDISSPKTIQFRRKTSGQYLYRIRANVDGKWSAYSNVHDIQVQVTAKPADTEPPFAWWDLTDREKRECKDGARPAWGPGTCIGTNVEIEWYARDNTGIWRVELSLFEQIDKDDPNSDIKPTNSLAVLFQNDNSAPPPSLGSKEKKMRYSLRYPVELVPPCKGGLQNAGSLGVAVWDTAANFNIVKATKFITLFGCGTRPFGQ